MTSATPSLILSARLRAAGESTQYIERGARVGEFVRVRPGAYLTAAEWQSLSPRDRHLVAMRAVSETSRRRLLFCAESAAALHGIPVLGAWPERPHIVDQVGRRRAALVGVATHRLDLPDEDVVQIGDVLATSPLRTAFEIAATRGFLAGVVALDYVLGAAFKAPRGEAEMWLERARPFRGARRADAALGVATGLAETPLESLSLGQCHLLGFPQPRQQVEFTVDGRVFRTDFYFEEADVIGEADGRSKYAPDGFDGSLPEARLWAEKDREDILRSVVRGFARWGWDHALGGHEPARRLHRAGVYPTRRFASSAIG
ncbi:MAG: hypothetical protein WBL06_13595 [Pseudolysinimonas sp.]|jgi:hypothetical protein|uniref:hypothetical protein n=1 Tax=Pseudolysinimonas sp. TaxID=2680009 RepID=UPI003C73DDDC